MPWRKRHSQGQLSTCMDLGPSRTLWILPFSKFLLYNQTCYCSSSDLVQMSQSWDGSSPNPEDIWTTRRPSQQSLQTIKFWQLRQQVDTRASFSQGWHCYHSALSPPNASMLRSPWTHCVFHYVRIFLYKFRKLWNRHSCQSPRNIRVQDWATFVIGGEL